MRCLYHVAQDVRRPPLFESKEEEVKINEPKLIKEVIASGGRKVTVLEAKIS